MAKIKVIKIIVLGRDIKDLIYALRPYNKAINRIVVRDPIVNGMFK